MSDYTIRVDTWEFRAALMSVLPHLAPPDDDPLLCRVRAYATPDGLVLVATDRFTAAMATADIIDSNGELGCFDFGVVDAKEILALFRPPKEAYAPQLRLEHNGNTFRITDASGMFDGKALKLEGFAAADQYPDVADIIGRAARAATLDIEVTGRWAKAIGSLGRYVVNPAHLARFVAAGKAYGVDLAIEPAGSPPALLVRCCANFAGLMFPRRLDDMQHGTWRASLVDLPDRARQVSMVHPIPEEVRSARDASEVQDLSDLIPTQNLDDEENSDG